MDLIMKREEFQLQFLRVSEQNEALRDKVERQIGMVVVLVERCDTQFTALLRY